jgi:hypothetical protein
LRMNRRLEDKLRECVAEQHGWHWALTSFARDVWGETKKDIEAESEVEVARCNLSFTEKVEE